MATNRGRRIISKSTPKPPEKVEVKSNLRRNLMVAIVIAIMATFLILLQSGVLSPSTGSSADETAVLGIFNAWEGAVKAHNGQLAIGYTTLHFLNQGDNASLYLINNISGIFSNPNLVFTASGITAIDSASMSPEQKAYSEQVITNITDQGKAVHIDQVVTGYALITGSMTLTGVPDLPAIDQLVMAKIGSSWYIVLGS